MAQLDRHTVRRFFLLVMPFFRSEKKWIGWGLVLLLFGLSLTVNAIGARMSYINRDFMTALNLKDSGRFSRELLAYGIAFLIATPIVVMYSYTEQRLSLMWRRWMSHYVLDRYFTDRTYYHLNLRGEIDNPDQRIEEDVRSFCAQSLSFSLILFSSFVQLYLYFRILWSISWWLFVVALGYAAIGSIATYFLGRPLIGLNFAQLRKEADYRYKLINVRDSAESIAFYGNERKEYTRTRQRLRSALQNLGLVINWNRNLQFFTTGYNYVLAVIPTVIVAPLFFDGKIEFGEVIQAGVAFGFVLNALSIVVNHFGNISIFAAVINRLGTFLEAIDRSKKAAKAGEGITTEIGPRIEFDKVTIFTPNRDQMLVNELTFQLEGRSLLLCGPSGSGKTSVLRAVAGLWSAGDGRIIRPPLSETFFIPQRPYMVLGTLRSQLVYGARTSAVVDSELIKVIESVGLLEMLERVGGLDAVFDWPNVLGTGEQQRLAFARVFLTRPKIVFLDEATTAVDRIMEKQLYAMLLECVQCFISTGNRLTLGEFHDRVIELQPGGRWRAV
jgi:vitamin B12/bleomycin/antimicrobial peptide transport system ATP-binding/permease protein